MWKQNDTIPTHVCFSAISAVQVDKIWQFKWQEGSISCSFVKFIHFLKKYAFVTIQWLGGVNFDYILLTDTQYGQTLKEKVGGGWSGNRLFFL